MDDDIARIGRPRWPASKFQRPDGARSPGGPPTTWTVVLDREYRVARRFLKDTVADPEAADQIFQRFAQTLLRGDLEGDDPGTGRLRDLIRTLLVRLIRSHRRECRRGAHLPMPVDGPAEPAAQRARFDAIWREELLGRAWRRLEAHEADTGQPFHTVLRCRVDAPGLSSPELAERVGHQLGRLISAPSSRQLLHQARAVFSRLLLDEVVATLPERSRFEAIERELIETGLLAFCREAVDRVRPSPGRR